MNTPDLVSRQPSCDDKDDPAWLPVDTALARIAQAVSPISDVEVVALREALDRVLGVDIQSPMAVPNHTNSAMDGYALRFADLNESPLRVVGTAWAGKAFAGSVGPGECARIMTGGVMPEGTDTVVMQEHVEQQDDYIRSPTGNGMASTSDTLEKISLRALLRWSQADGCCRVTLAWWHL